MMGRKVMLGFKFILHKVERPKDQGNVNAWKMNIQCTIDNV
jgi:hypothetical protein